MKLQFPVTWSPGAVGTCGLLPIKPLRKSGGSSEDEGTEKLKAEGWVVVSPEPRAKKEPLDAPYVLREEPTKEQKP